MPSLHVATSALDPTPPQPQQTPPRRWLGQRGQPARLGASRACSPLRLLLLALLLTTGLLGGCGGGGGGADPGSGGGGGGGGGGPGPDPSTLLTTKASFSAADLRHFLTRTHFGVKASELAAVTQQGLPAYVASMLSLPAPGTSAVDVAANAVLVNMTDPPGLQGGFPTQGQCAQWWQNIMQRTTTPFQEVVALFWHDHFAASNAALETNATWWTKPHINLWRAQGTGNLKTLALAMARDSLMLFYLDNVLNTAAAPNENFMREFWELFLLGVDNGYVQADIVEGARAFTGYRQRTNPVTNQAYTEFDFTRHDETAKTVFGVLIPSQASGANEHDDFAEMVDITFAQRPVEDFIARKILEYFCYADPPGSVVSELGAILRQGGWELAPVFQTLFLSEAFYSDKAKTGFVKGPVEHALGFVRSTGLLAPERSVLDGGLSFLGQRPTQPPSVNGWPLSEAWLSAQGMVDRANLVNGILSSRVFQAGLGLSPAQLLPPAPSTTAQVVDALVSTLNVTVSAAEHAQYVAYLDQNAAGQPDPFNASDPQDVDLRVRGLLWILSQHPTYTVR